MLESFKTDKFNYKRLTLEEQKNRGILGRLVGVIADTTGATRNGRKYSSTLWENVFASPVMKEKINNHCLFGELGHPVDREEVDMEKVAICMAELPKKGEDGKLYGVFDILSTPNGKILKSLCDYGCNIGISSRGTGDLFTDENGDESVDPDTYVCECFDAVLIPAVESARLKYVTEALDTKKYNKTLRQSLSESLNRSSDKDRKIMQESLDELGIDLNESKLTKDEALEELIKEFYNVAETISDSIDTVLTTEDIDFAVDQTIKALLNDEIIDECDSENCADKEEQVQEEVVDNKSDEIVAKLQEALIQKKKLVRDNLMLKAKLSVCDAKEISLSEELKKHKVAVANLSDKAKDSKKLKLQNSELNESLKKLNSIIKTKESKIEALNEELESATKSKSEITKLQSELADLHEQLDATNNQLTSYSKNLTKYRKAYASLKESYLKAKADNYDVSVSAVKANLNESYTVKDIDNICLELAKQQKAINKLPIKLDENTSVKVFSKKEYIGDRKAFDNSDDDVSTLLELIQ